MIRKEKARKPAKRRVQFSKQEMMGAWKRMNSEGNNLQSGVRNLCENKSFFSFSNNRKKFYLQDSIS